MKISIRKGISFGITSGIITTLGLIIGLNASTHSKFVVIGGILIIAIADAFSDAVGIHISEEAENIHSTKEIWEATLSTLLSKFVFALTFIVPILLFKINLAVIISVIWGLSLLGVLSYFISKQKRINPSKVILEHLSIAVIVIIITYCVGTYISRFI